LVSQFQSLVGKLETWEIEQGLTKIDLFQSLVGKLETRQEFLSGLVSPEFQSLVGKLETDFISELISAEW